jgi:hypothetical protein
MSTATVSLQPPVAVQWVKNGRIITLGKIFQEFDGSLCFGTPYAGRPFSTPSLPLRVYEFLLGLNVRFWIIRFDRRQKAYRIRLDAIGRLGSLTDDGELSVPLHLFEPCRYPTWPYAVRSILVPPMPNDKTTTRGNPWPSTEWRVS